MFQLATVFSVKSIVKDTKIVIEGFTKRTKEQGFKEALRMRKKIWQKREGRDLSWEVQVKPQK